MRLYENDPYNGLERLQRTAQNFYDDVLEVRAIWDTQGVVYDDMRTRIVRAIENCIIRTADADALTKYERFLEIWYDEGLPDIDFRRAMVAAAFVATRHIGRPEILELLSLFTKREGRVEFDDGVVSIWVDGYLSDEGAFLRMLEKKLPAHLGLRVTVVIHREIRSSLPFSFGEATGGMLSGEPAQRKRTESIRLGAMPRGRATSIVDGQYPDTRRVARIDMPAGTGGAIAMDHAADILTRDHGGTMSIGADARAKVSSRTAHDIANSRPRTERRKQAALTGGAIHRAREAVDIAPPARKQARQATPSSGGVFLRTRTTGRPIRREEDNARDDKA